jgi:putative FmdB family regulatory protein
MPIYAYKCAACGHRQDVLQKISDPVLTECPACRAQALEKQITAAGFQLKGSGWYVTDFKHNGKGAPADKASGGKASGGKASGDKADAAKADGAGKPDEKDTAATPSTPAPPPSTSGGQGGA